MKTKYFFLWFLACLLLPGILSGIALAAPPPQKPTPPPREQEEVKPPPAEADRRGKGPAYTAWRALPPEVRIKIDPRLIAELDGEVLPAHLAANATFGAKAPSDQLLDKTRFIIRLTTQTDLATLAAQPFANLEARRTAVFNALQTTAQASQAPLKAYLDSQRSAGQVNSYQPFFIFNGMAIEGNLATLLELAKRPDVERIMANYPLVSLAEPDLAPPASPQADLGGLPPANWNTDLVDAERVWNELGVTGVGAVVGGFDTGVDWTHPALQSGYRGYSLAGSNHNYNWFEPDGNLYPGGNLGPSLSSAPFDCDIHGTHTMGTMVGKGSSPNTQVGMAPGAKWIAVPGICGGTMPGGVSDDIGGLKAFQWFLCPTDLSGNLTTANCAKAPHVINNSWGSSNPADDTFRPAIQALRAAGVAPVFAAGNPGAGAGSIGSPGSAPEAITVGATDIDDKIAGFSGRGPSFYPGEQKPELSAPGVDVKSTVPGGYANFSGTSMAAPHVAGLIALMVSADLKDGVRDLSADELEYFMQYTALDLGSAGPDNDYGWGRINALGAVRWALSAGGLRGVVRNATTNQPIDRATMRGVKTSPADTFSTSTSADGQYSVTVPAGIYNLTIDAWGYNSSTFAQQLVITGSNSLKDFSLTPLPTASLTGQVLHGSTPIAGAKVYVAAHPSISVTTDPGGNYSLVLPVGSHELVVEATGYRIKQESVTVAAGSSSHNFVLTPAPTILLVEADASQGWFFSRPTHNFFQQSLDAKGYAYDKFSITNTLQLPNLASYGLVIWSHANGAPVLGGYESLLTSYLDGGGRLILSGQNIGAYDLGSNFFDNYLHANLLTDVASSTGESISGQNFLTGLSLTFNESDLYNYPNSTIFFSPDAVAARDGHAYPVMTYDNGAGTAVLAVDPCNQNFRAVYFAAGYETLGPRGNTPAPHYAEVLARSIDWVMQNKPARGVLLEPPTGIQTGSQGAAVSYTLTIYNIGTLTDTYNLNLSSPWPAAVDGGLTTIGPLPACSAQSLNLTVDIPANVPNNAVNTAQLTAVSQAQANVSSSGQYRTFAFSYGGDWQIEPEPMVAGQFWTSAASANSGIYVVGGVDSSGSVSADLQFFNGQTWDQLAPKPTARMGVGLAALGGKLYAAGGNDDEFNGQTELEIYDIASNTWSSGPPLPVAKGGAAAAAANGKIYLFGGSPDAFFSSMTKETWEFNPANGQWTQKSDFPGEGRTFAAAVELNGLIYLVGGWGSSGNELKDAYAYNPATNTWTTLARLDQPRQGLGLVALGGQLYAIAGANGFWFNILTSVERYDPASNAWFEAPNLNIARGGLTAGSVGERIFALGGQVGEGLALEPGPVESLNFGPGLEKTVDKLIAQPGETVNYTLTIVNGAIAHQVNLRDVLPTGLTFAGFTQNPGGASHASGVVSWNGALAPQQTVELAFNATIASQSWTFGQVITNVATLTSDNITMSDFALTSLDFPDFSHSTKTVNKTMALAGDVLTYTIHVENPSASSRPIQVQDTVPANTTYVPGSFAYTLGNGSSETYLNANQAFTWSAILPAVDDYTNNSGNYEFGDSSGGGVVQANYDWIEVAPPAGGAGTAISFPFGLDEDYFYPLPLPFSFNFYGTNYTNLAVGTNGVLYFEDGLVGYSNGPIPGLASIERFIAPFWDDLVIYPGGVYYQVIGDAPNRRFIIEYYQVSGFASSSNDYGTWQIILHEGSNIILFQYQDVNFGEVFYDFGASATVGIQSNSTTGLEYSFNQPVLTDGLAVVFLPPGATFLTPINRATITFAAVTNGSLAVNTWITNTATVSGAGQTLARQATTRVNPVILSQSSLVASPTIVGKNETVRYSFALRNTGLVTTTATLTDPLPAAITYLPGSISCDGGAICSENSGVVTWQDTLAAGEVRSLVFSATLTANLPDLTPVVNQATLTDNAGSTAVLTGTFTARRGNLGSSFKTVLPAQVDPGEVVTYTIYVRNNSPIEVAAALTDTLPTGLGYMGGSLDCGVGTCNANAGTITWNGLVPGLSMIPIRFQAQVSPTVIKGSVITNTAQLLHLGEADYAVAVGLFVGEVLPGRTVYLPVISKETP